MLCRWPVAHRPDVTEESTHVRPVHIIRVPLDLVEVNPILDIENTTATLGTELVLSALGMKIL